MSRSSPIGQLGTKLPLRRPTADDPLTAPITQPRWPASQYAEPQAQRGQQQAYAQPSAHGQQQAPGYYFPQGGEAEQAQGYAPQANGNQQLPFSRLPPMQDGGSGHAHGYAAQPQSLPFSRLTQPQQPAQDANANFGFPPQASEPPPFGQPAQSAPPWSQQHHQQQDPRGFDLGNYMPAPGQAPMQGYADPDQAHYQQQDPALFGAAHQGYEGEGDYEEQLPEEEEAPARGRRGMLIVAALVGAIGLGGGMAYTYKTLFTARGGPAPVIKDTQGPTKSKPEVADGRGFPHTDKKLLNRLGDDASPSASPVVPASADTPEERASDDPNSPRRVRTIQISPSGGPSPQMAMPPAAGPAPIVSVPGVTLESTGPRPMPRMQGPGPGAPPSAARIDLPPQGPPARPVPPVRVASAANTPPPLAAEPPPVVKKTPVAKAPPAAPKTKEAAVTTGGTSGYVAVLSSQKSRMDALKIFANMQEKYGDVLSSKTPDVQEANLGEKGVWYRLVVGPPGSRDSASGVCSQLKTAGYANCWVTTY